MSSRRCCGSTPTMPHAHFNLGMAYGQQGRTDDEMREYQAALRINPALAKAHYNLGVICEHQGHADEAVRMYQAALRANPDYGEAHRQPGGDLRAAEPHR